jgi:hypothetical protein
MTMMTAVMRKVNIAIATVGALATSLSVGPLDYTPKP